MSQFDTTLPWSKYLAAGVTAGDMATTGGATVAIADVKNYDSVGLQFSWEGTSPVGAITLAGSNNYNQYTNSGAGAVWTDVPATIIVGSLAVSGNTGNTLATVNLKELFRVQKLRATYTPSSGVGALTCNVNGKG